MSAKRHKTFIHHDFKSHDPRLKELVVECTACTFLAKGFTRKADAQKVANQHEGQANG